MLRKAGRMSGDKEGLMASSPTGIPNLICQSLHHKNWHQSRLLEPPFSVETWHVRDTFKFSPSPRGRNALERVSFALTVKVCINSGENQPHNKEVGRVCSQSQRLLNLPRQFFGLHCEVTSYLNCMGTLVSSRTSMLMTTHTHKRIDSSKDVT